MKMVVGLGNPGSKYQQTRHNVGFDVLACLAGRFGAAAARSKFQADVTDVLIGNEKTLLVAPQTYMNLSGRSVRRAIDFFQLPLDDLLVVCDDMNLDTGRLRWRRSGSAGGQKGLQNIIDQLGTQELCRLRIGIGRPPASSDPSEYVLRRFRPAERDVINQTTELAADGVETWVTEGIDAAMNRYNQPPPD